MRMGRQPRSCDPAARDPVVVENNVQAFEVQAIISRSDFKQSEEEIGVLGLALGVEDGSSVGVEGSGEITLSILPWGRDGDLLATPGPHRTKLWIEMDIRFVDIETGGVRTRGWCEGAMNGGGTHGISRVADV